MHLAVTKSADQADTTHITDKNDFSFIDIVRAAATMHHTINATKNSNVEKFVVKGIRFLSSDIGTHAHVIGNKNKNTHHREYAHINATIAPTHTHKNNISAYEITIPFFIISLFFVFYNRTTYIQKYIDKSTKDQQIIILS